MKPFTFRCALITLTLIAPGLVWADDKKPNPADLDRQAAQPAAIHKEMAKLAGDYTTVTKLRLSPDTEPTETTGAAKLTVILDGRFLQDENTVSMFGQSYKGLRLYGYNNGSKQFEATWFYTGSTGTMRLIGSSKDEGKTVDWTASYDDANGKQNLQVITKIVDADHFVVEMIAKLPDGKKGPSFETTYTRRK